LLAMESAGVAKYRASDKTFVSYNFKPNLGDLSSASGYYFVPIRGGLRFASGLSLLIDRLPIFLASETY